MRGMFSALAACAFVPLAAFAQINSSFFGLEISGDRNVSWPNSITQPLKVSAVRLWDSGTRWNQLEPSPGGYNWYPLDRLLVQAQANKQTVLYTFGGVPSYASSDPDDASCAEGAGSCDPPSDINEDGSGTDNRFKAFVTSLMEHTGQKIKYFEMWNELNSTSFWNGSAASMVRMAWDARRIIRSYNPSAIVLTPSLCSCFNGPITNWTFWTTNPQDALRYYLTTSANVSGAPTGAKQADGVAIHAYVGNNPPENILPYLTGTQSAMEQQNVSSLPLFITENSWGANTNIAGCSLNPPFTKECVDTASAFLARSFALAASYNVSAYYWYSWGNDNRGTLYNTSTGKLYEPGSAFAQVRNWLSGTTFPAPCSNNQGVYTCELTRPDGFQALLVWDTSQNCTSGCTTSTFKVPIGYTTRYDLAGDPPVTLGSTTNIGIKPVLLTNINCKVTNPMCEGL